MKKIITCNHCQSRRYVRAGKTNYGIQLYKCKSEECGKRFVEKTLQYWLKTPIKIIAVALKTYATKKSLRETSKHLFDYFKININYTTIRTWIIKFTPIFKRFIQTLKPKLSGFRHLDEQFFTWNNRNPHRRHQILSSELYYVWNCFDDSTRFVSYPEISTKRSHHHVIRLLDRVVDIVGKKPQLVGCDKYRGYKKGINKALFSNKHRVKLVFFNMNKGEHGNNIIERFHRTIRTRTRLMFGYRPKNCSRAYLDLLYTDYNFTRYHSAIKATPATKAGIGLNLTPNYRGLLKLLKMSLRYDMQISCQDK